MSEIVVRATYEMEVCCDETQIVASLAAKLFEDMALLLRAEVVGGRVVSEVGGCSSFHNIGNGDARDCGILRCTLVN